MTIGACIISILVGAFGVAFPDLMTKDDSRELWIKRICLCSLIVGNLGLLVQIFM
jgi:hypothetical protein